MVTITYHKQCIKKAIVRRRRQYLTGHRSSRCSSSKEFRSDGLAQQAHKTHFTPMHVAPKHSRAPKNLRQPRPSWDETPPSRVISQGVCSAFLPRWYMSAQKFSQCPFRAPLSRIQTYSNNLVLISVWGSDQSTRIQSDPSPQEEAAGFSPLGHIKSAAQTSPTTIPFGTVSPPPFPFPA